MVKENIVEPDIIFGRSSLKEALYRTTYYDDTALKLCYHRHALTYVGKKYDEEERKYPISFRKAISEAMKDLTTKLNFKKFGRKRRIGSPRYSGDGTIEFVVFGGDFYFDSKKIRAAVYLRPSDGYPYQVISVFTRAGDKPLEIFNLINEWIKEKNPLRGNIINIYGDEENFGDYDWNDIAIPESFRQEVEENLIWPIKYNKGIKSANLRVPRGVILEGELGTGKTLLSKVIANKVKGHGTFIKARPSEIEELRWDYVFEVARTLEPSVLYIEDIDAFAPTERTPTISAFLTDFLDYLDGTGERGDVMVLASTNSPEIIDPRMIDRPGRIDRRLIFNPKDKENFGLEWKEKTLEIHLRGHRLEDGLNPRSLARMIENVPYTGSHIRELVHTTTLEFLGSEGIENQDVVSNIVLTEEDFRRANERVRSNYKLNGKTD